MHSVDRQALSKDMCHVDFQIFKWLLHFLIQIIVIAVCMQTTEKTGKWSVILQNGKNHNEINYVHLKNGVSFDSNLLLLQAEFNAVALRATLAANLGAFFRRTMTQIKARIQFYRFTAVTR